MAQVSRTAAKTARPEEDSWPWRCLGCEATIYHDVEWCRDCRRVLAVAPGPNRRRPVAAFLDWIRGEPCTVFVTKVAAVASLELVLTALWLQLMLVGPA